MFLLIMNYISRAVFYNMIRPGDNTMFSGSYKLLITITVYVKTPGYYSSVKG